MKLTEPSLRMLIGSILDQDQDIRRPADPRHQSLIWTRIGHMGASSWEQGLLGHTWNMGTYWDQFSSQIRLI